MKRSKEQKIRHRVTQFPSGRNIGTMSKDEKHHINRFLDPESKLQFSHVNKSRFQESKSDQDLQCYKSTNHLVACSGAFKKMQIGEECLVFCKKHVNEVITKIIDIMISGRIYTRFPNGSILKVPFPEIRVVKLDSEDNEYEVFFIDANTNNTIEIGPDESVGSWATQEFDFEHENWFEMQIFFGENWNAVFYDFQNMEWDLNYNSSLGYISIKNLSFKDEYEEIDDEGDESLDMEELE
jgi:hypothetical protein